MVEFAHIDERIRVAAIFGDCEGGIRPVWFEWRKRRIQVEKIAYRWQGRRGTEKLLYFAVSSQGNSYELCYFTANQYWRLNRTCSG